MAAEACPSIRCTALTLAPASIASEAAVAVAQHRALRRGEGQLVGGVRHHGPGELVDEEAGERH
jgi:hypothetical protein